LQQRRNHQAETPCSGIVTLTRERLGSGVFSASEAALMADPGLEHLAPRLGQGRNERSRR